VAPLYYTLRYYTSLFLFLSLSDFIVLSIIFKSIIFEDRAEAKSTKEKKIKELNFGSQCLDGTSVDLYLLAVIQETLLHILSLGGRGHVLTLSVSPALQDPSPRVCQGCRRVLNRSEIMSLPLRIQPRSEVVNSGKERCPLLLLNPARNSEIPIFSQ